MPSNLVAPGALYVLVSPMNSSKSSQTIRTGIAKKWESMNALSMVGCIGVARRLKAVMLQEKLSPGRASSTYTGINCPALNVVFNPWVLSNVDRLMSACGTSAN